MKPLVLIYILFFSIFLNQPNAMAFDHQHTAWNLLLSKHVKWVKKGTASRVDYAGLKTDLSILKGYLLKLSAIDLDTFNGFSRNQRLAFLINAYNAFTVDLILTKYPEIDSIKDLGSFLTSPWKIDFITLFGKSVNLDEIEHGMIREPGAYDEPRIHFAVVCAAIGCPGLRNEAFIATKLDSQLENSLERFLSDKTRNRFNSKSGTIEVSKIFKWYRSDFKKGNHSSLKDWFTDYAHLLSEDRNEQNRLKNKTVDIEFLKYDWKLNDLSR